MPAMRTETWIAFLAGGRGRGSALTCCAAPRPGGAVPVGPGIATAAMRRA
jgi:hypothetical protein